MTSIQDRFCPKCGGPLNAEGLCVSCRIKETPWAVCDARVTSTHCPGCGATKQGNTWTDTDLEKDEIGLPVQDVRDMLWLEAHPGPGGQAGAVPGPGSTRQRPLHGIAP